MNNNAEWISYCVYFPSIVAELLTSKEHCFYPDEVVVHITTQWQGRC